MKPITHMSQQGPDYVAALRAVTTLAELRALTAEYGELCEDAKAIADTMTEADFDEYMAGSKLERSGFFAGDEFAHKYGAIMMPLVMIKATLIADKHKCPWGLAYLSMKDAKRS